MFFETSDTDLIEEGIVPVILALGVVGVLPRRPEPEVHVFIYGLLIQPTWIVLFNSSITITFLKFSIVNTHMYS